MALTLSDVDKLARLSRLSLSEAERNNMLTELNHVFDLVEKSWNPIMRTASRQRFISCT